MIKYVLTTLSLLLLSLSSALAVDYTIVPPKSPLRVDRQQQLIIQSDKPIEVGELADNHDVTWLNHRSSPYTLNGVAGHQLSLWFVPHKSGTLRIPPVPVVIDGTELLLRPESMVVEKNSAPKESLFIKTLWNGSPTPPSSARAGQTINLEVLQFIEKTQASPYYLEPTLDLSGARWINLAKQTNFLPNSTQDLRFYSFGRKNHAQSLSNYKGKKFTIRRYKTRFTVGSTGTLTGKIASTLFLGAQARTHVQRIEIPILPIPPAPEEKGLVHSGLVGEWQLTAKVPETIKANEAFELTIDIEGVGDHHQLEEPPLDFPGFKSLGSSVTTKDKSTLDRWRGTITHRLLPTGSSPFYPELRVTSFDTKNDKWITHTLSAAIPVEGAKAPAAQGATAEGDSPQLTELGTSIQRPILRNLPLLPTLLCVLTPLLLLPLAKVLKSWLAKRDPERQAKRAELAACLKKLNALTAADDASQCLEDEVLPLLRYQLKLPNNSSTHDVAQALATHAPDSELADILSQHANASYTGNKLQVAPSKLATLLAKLTFALLVVLLPARTLHAETSLESANQAYASGAFKQAITQYQELATTHPNHANLHYNLGNALVADGQLHRARASYHTALLLDPTHPEARDRQAATLQQLGEPSLPGSKLLVLRPDQYILVAAIIWACCWALLAARHFFSKLPRWIALLPMLVLVPSLVGTAIWKMNTSYANDQFMVIVKELPPQSEPGKPDHQQKMLRSGDIIRSHTFSPEATHVRVQSSQTSFWLPVDQLQKIW